MAQTSISGTSAYLTVAQLLERYDVRTIGDLLSDTGIRLTSSQVTSSTTLTTLLKQASGLVEASVLAGGRYTREDLAALTGNSIEFLRGLVADLVMYLLWSRRPNQAVPPPPQSQEALKWLDRLREGVNILAFQQTADAGRKVEWPTPPQNRLTKRIKQHLGILDLELPDPTKT